MKTTIAITTFAVLLLAACGEKETTATLSVPDVAKRAFEATYPEVKDAQWKHDEDGFEAEWKAKGMEHAVVYDAKGNVLLTEEQVTQAQMPAAIAPYLAAKQAGKAIVKVGMVTKGAANTYEVELENGGKELELLFDADGNYIGTEADDSAEDGEGEEDQD